MFSETVPPERQHRNSFQMDSLHATHKPSWKHSSSCAFVNITYQHKSASPSERTVHTKQA